MPSASDTGGLSRGSGDVSPTLRSHNPWDSTPDLVDDDDLGSTLAGGYDAVSNVGESASVMGGIPVVLRQLTPGQFGSGFGSQASDESPTSRLEKVEWLRSKLRDPGNTRTNSCLNGQLDSTVDAIFAWVKAADDRGDLTVAPGEMFKINGGNLDDVGGIMDDENEAEAEDVAAYTSACKISFEKSEDQYFIEFKRDDSNGAAFVLRGDEGEEGSFLRENVRYEHQSEWRRHQMDSWRRFERIRPAQTMDSIRNGRTPKNREDRLPEYQAMRSVVLAFETKNTHYQKF